MTNPINLLNNNDNLSLGQILAEIHYHIALSSAMREANVSAYDMAAINQLIDTYGVGYRGASMVREYLESRE